VRPALAQAAQDEMGWLATGQVLVGALG